MGKRLLGLVVLALAPVLVRADLFGKYGPLIVAGTELSSLQSGQVQAAIDQLRIDGEEACADGLEMMLATCRICVEQGSINLIAAGTTQRDGFPGPYADGMNLNPDIINGNPTILKCTLAHEWVHVNQESGQTSDEREKEAYEAELKCLCASGDRSTEVQERKATVTEILAGLCEDDERRDPSVLPFGGLDLLYLGNAVIVIDQFTNTVRSWSDLGTTNSYDLQFVHTPFALLSIALAGPSGGAVVAVAGLDLAGDGAIEYVEFDPAAGAVLQSLRSTALSGSTPFSIAHAEIAGPRRRLGSRSARRRNRDGRRRRRRRHARNGAGEPVGGGGFVPGGRGRSDDPFVRRPVRGAARVVRRPAPARRARRRRRLRSPVRRGPGLRRRRRLALDGGRRLRPRTRFSSAASASTRRASTSSARRSRRSSSGRPMRTVRSFNASERRSSARIAPARFGALRR